MATRIEEGDRSGLNQSKLASTVI